MADSKAVAFVESVYSRTDKQIRDLLAAMDLPLATAAVQETDTINVIIGDGVNPITPGIAAAIRVDFQSEITGIFFQEFDGTTGSIRIDVERAQGDSAPTWARISPTTRPGFTSDRFSSDTTLVGWLPTIQRHDYLRFVVASAALVMRVHVGLSIRRLE